MPVAVTADEAAALVDLRPARLSFGIDLPADPTSVQRAREAVRDALLRWRIAERADVLAVVIALTTNAVEHAGTPFRLRVVVERTSARVSVRDGRPDPAPDPDDPSSRGGGLRGVARLSRTWGVLRYGDGKSVWAQLALARATVAPERTDTGTRAPALRPPGGPAMLGSVSVLRRRRFVTTDAEHAHAFLRAVYGEHTLRLTGTDEQPGFHLEFDGVATNRFAVERLTHGAAVDGAFPAADALVVVHAIRGDLRIATRREAISVAPGDVVVCGLNGSTLVSSTGLDAELVRLPAAAVARVTAELTRFEARSVPFGLHGAVSPARAALWRATIDHLRRDVLGNDEAMASPLARASVLRTLVAVLVETFPNPARDALTDPGTTEAGRAAPRTVRRAVAFIEGHAGDDVGLADIAAAAGVGARALQLAFRRHTDATPLEYLRRVRLDRAHRELEAGDPGQTTVRTVARRWGFPHHSSFSTLYLRTYGRSPSTTLRS